MPTKLQKARTKQALRVILTLARKNILPGYGLPTSAKLALADAEALALKGETQWALARALTSLRYSCGIHSTVYKQAEARIVAI